MLLRRSLLRKFAALMGLFALTMATGLGAAVGLGASVDNQVTAPVRSLLCAMNGLSSVEGALVTLERALAEPECGPDCPTGCEGVLLAASSIRRAASFADDHPPVERMLGPAATRRLVTLLSVAVDRSTAGAGPGDDRAAARAEALRAVRDALSFVDTVRRSVTVDAERAVRFGEEMRELEMLTLKAGLVCSAMICVLALLLIHRWVMAPVARLREAAARLATGDLTHRVRVCGEDEIADLTARVNTMAASITEIQERVVERERLAAVGEMVRRLAHNLRNPLGGIRNLAELARMRAEQPEVVREMQTEIIHAVDRFNHWLGELLVVTGPVKLRLEAYEVGPWLEGAMEAVRPMATARGVRLELTHADSAGLLAWFDAHRLEHAVVALLTNALQASPAGGVVRVRVREEDASPGVRSGWRLEVEDDGPGVPEEIRHLVFQPFFTTKPDGNGIGLASANQIVTGHGGRIELVCGKGRGSLCVVRLPRYPSAAGGGEVAAEMSRMAENRRRDRVLRGAHIGHRRRADFARDGSSGP